MQDRIPTYPGRVKLTPVSGDLYDMERADQPTQPGTPLNKASLLTDATAALFGLTSAAVPDDILAWLGGFNKYWWRRISVSYTITMTDIASGTIGSSTQTMHYSSSVDVVDGVIALHNPSSASIAVSTAGAQEMVSHAPCYYYMGSNSSVIRYLPSGATSGTATSYTIRYYSSQSRLEYGSTASVKAKTCAATRSYGTEEYVSSSTRNAYPDSGESSGYEYEYVGQPLSDLPSKPRVETGTYVGTGTKGESDPNTLTFSFTPKLVIIVGTYFYTGGSAVTTSMFIPYIWGLGFFYTGSDFSSNFAKVNVTISGNTMSWWTSTNDSYQLNASNYVYHYVAIGW